MELLGGQGRWINKENVRGKSRRDNDSYALVPRLKDRKLSLYDNGAGNEEMCQGSRGAYERFGDGLRRTMTTGATSCRCLIKCKP